LKRKGDFRIRLFEFEAKALLKDYGISVPTGRTAHSLGEVWVERPY
jgi:succinyl-CoA synthetase beta subunit